MPPVAPLAIAQCNVRERRPAEPRRGVGARQQPVLHVDEVPLGVGLALERLRQLLALRVLAPHGEVDDGLAVLAEPSADVRHALQPSTRPRVVRTASPSSAPYQLDERLSKHEHPPADVERRDLAAGDRVVRSRSRDAEEPGDLVHRELSRSFIGSLCPSSVVRSSVISSSPTYRGNRAPSAAPNVEEFATTTHMHQRFVPGTRPQEDALASEDRDRNSGGIRAPSGRSGK